MDPFGSKAVDELEVAVAEADQKFGSSSLVAAKGSEGTQLKHSAAAPTVTGQLEPVVEDPEECQSRNWSAETVVASSMGASGEQRTSLVEPEEAQRAFFHRPFYLRSLSQADV